MVDAPKHMVWFFEKMLKYQMKALFGWNINEI